MSNDKYHHGNLRNALIEEGIKLVNEGGNTNLSLRKVAAQCGVSYAAPYAHFANKEEMIQSMQEYVVDKFMIRLQSSTPNSNAPYTAESIINLGRNYVGFFLENPNYFPFLFSHPCMKVQLSLTENATDNFPPYEYFKETLIRYNQENGETLSNDEQELQIIRLWATVHGIASIATMKNVSWDKKWEEHLHSLIY